MTNRTAATRYARALLEIATKEQADLSRVETDLAGFAALVDANPALRNALLNPVVPAARKRAAVEAIVAQAGIGTVVGKLLALLADRDRFILLPDLLDVFGQRLMEQRNIVRAQVTTATPIADAQANDIAQSLAKATGRDIVLTTAVDPSIIGGLVARVGGTVFDGSVTNQLQRLKQRLQESV